MTLPKQYAWLAREPGPKMIVEALKHYGVREIGGKASNPVVIGWARELGIDWYVNDDTPWCGLFMGYVANAAGKPAPKELLRALAWKVWGEEAPAPMLGDVLAFKRKGGGHVGLYVGEDATHFHVLGGNQGDAVSIKRIAKVRLVAARRLYRTTPANVRKVMLKASGAVSENEA